MRSPRPAASTMRLHARAAALAARALARGNSATARRSRNAASSRKLGVARAGVAHVVERARQIQKVAGLAVAVPQARKYAEHLQVALHADEVEPAQKLRSLGPAAKPRAQQSAR